MYKDYVQAIISGFMSKGVSGISGGVNCMSKRLEGMYEEYGYLQGSCEYVQVFNQGCMSSGLNPGCISK